MSIKYNQNIIEQSIHEINSLYAFVDTLKQLSMEKVKSVRTGLCRLSEPSIDYDFALLKRVHSISTGSDAEGIKMRTLSDMLRDRNYLLDKEELYSEFMHWNLEQSFEKGNLEINIVEMSALNCEVDMSSQNLEISINTCELPALKFTFNLSSGENTLAAEYTQYTNRVTLNTRLDSDSLLKKAIEQASDLSNAAKAVLISSRVNLNKFSLPSNISNIDSVEPWCQSIPLLIAIEKFMFDKSVKALEHFLGFRELYPENKLINSFSLMLRQCQIADQIGAKELTFKLNQLSYLIKSHDQNFIPRLLAACYDTHNDAGRYITELINLKTIDFNTILKCNANLSYYYHEDAEKFQELASCLSVSQSIDDILASDFLPSNLHSSKQNDEQTQNLSNSL